MSFLQNFRLNGTRFGGFVLVSGMALTVAGAQTAATTVPDAQVEANVLRQLASAPELSTQDIQSSAVYGVVTLSGVVQSEELRTKAENLTARAQGVKKVVDELTLVIQTSRCRAIRMRSLMVGRIPMLLRIKVRRGRVWCCSRMGRMLRQRVRMGTWLPFLIRVRRIKVRRSRLITSSRASREGMIRGNRGIRMARLLMARGTTTERPMGSKGLRLRRVSRWVMRRGLMACLPGDLMLGSELGCR